MEESAKNIFLFFLSYIRAAQKMFYDSHEKYSRKKEKIRKNVS
jgi:hypothetical protein